MATAQLLKITHGVDGKVNDVNNTVKLVLNGTWWLIYSYLFHRDIDDIWPDGKETKVMVQRTIRETTAMANNVSEMMSSLTINPTPRSRIYA